MSRCMLTSSHFRSRTDKYPCRQMASLDHNGLILPLESEFFCPCSSSITVTSWMSAVTGLLIVCSTVSSGADKKKTSKLRAFGLCEWSSSMTGELPFTKSWWCGKCFHLMTSSWPVYPLYTTYVAWRMKMLLLQWLLHVIMIHCRYITNITQPYFGHIFLKLYDSGQ